MLKIVNFLKAIKTEVIYQVVYTVALSDKKERTRITNISLIAKH